MSLCKAHNYNWNWNLDVLLLAYFFKSSGSILTDFSELFTVFLLRSSPVLDHVYVNGAAVLKLFGFKTPDTLTNYWEFQRAFVYMGYIYWYLPY